MSVKVLCPLRRVSLRKTTCYFIVYIYLITPVFSNYVNHRGALHFEHEDGRLSTLAWVVRLIPDVHLFGNNFSDFQNVSGFENEQFQFANNVASELGLINQGKISHFQDYYLFLHPFYLKFSKYNSTDFHNSQPSWEEDNSRNELSEQDIFFRMKVDVESKLKNSSSVVWYKQELMYHRSKRMLTFDDPYYPQQWHLHNSRIRGMDLNVSGLWEKNITGKGVTVCVVDDGLEWSNKDLINNYSPEGSWDLNDNDADPMPSKDGKKNEHGTRCAGEIAAARNSFCGVGVAYDARISGLKVLDGKMTDSLEATAFNKNMDINDIYTCSWGPEDDGKTIDGPHHLSAAALEYGVQIGRRGYGTVYVVASGNGGLNNDNCNYDGYANSIYTVTIGAVDEYGQIPYYAEECAAMLAVTFSSGGVGDHAIVTTDWSAVDGSGCTIEHTGTSAAAPLAAAVIALMLQVRPCLSWRDIQYLIVSTSTRAKARSENTTWHVNTAGLKHSNHFGFGLLNPWNLVTAAKIWEPVPFLSTFASQKIKAGYNIPLYPNMVLLSFNVTQQLIDKYLIIVMEYARVRLSVKHPCRGRLEVRLRCPSGSESILATPREKDKSPDGLSEWVFSTVRCWGEEPLGQWTLLLTDWGNSSDQLGIIDEWQLIVHGTPISQSDLITRFRLAREAATGTSLDDDTVAPCQPALESLGEKIALGDRTLKIVALTGGFLFLLAIFETLEYMMCYKAEKDKFYQELSRVRQRRSGLADANECRNGINGDDMTDARGRGLLNPERAPLLSCETDDTAWDEDERPEDMELQEVIASPLTATNGVIANST